MTAPRETLAEHERRAAAEQNDGREQQRDRVEQEAQPGDGGDRYFGDLQPACDAGLVVAVGEFAAEGRQDEHRHDQRGAGERHQSAAFRGAELEQNQDDQRVLDEVVAERGKELANEDRYEASRGQKLLKHIAGLSGLGRGRRVRPCRPRAAATRADDRT